MISFEKNFIFIHIPKTGGNSIQNILRDYSDEKIVCKASYQDGFERFELESKQFGTTKHSSVNEYKIRLPSEFFEASYKFTCIRNPWDRMISFYFSPHRGVKYWDRNLFIELINNVQPALNYLRIPKEDANNILKKFDYIIHFDQLEEGFSDVCKQIGITKKSLPVRNKAIKSHYTKYYDDELVQIVGNLFEDEISLFNHLYNS